MTNIERAGELLERVRGWGVDEFCVCAGSRNSPLLAVLAVSDVRIFSFVDERSAAFFALGRMKQHGRPVAVVTTSGTAVAELLPGTVEAYYSGLPLILVTADRPARFRGTGAPQCIEQEGIFGPYATTSIDEWTKSGPLHLNVEFDEPLIDRHPERSEGSVRVEARVTSPQPPQIPRYARDDIPFRAPLVILGGLGSADRDRVRDFALRLNAPVYAEPLSGLREDARLEQLRITAGERMIGRGDFDGVIRIGDVPTLRFWRDLEESRSAMPVISFSRSRFAGLSRGDTCSIESLPAVTARDRDESFFEEDRRRAKQVAEMLDAEPLSEPALFRDVSASLAAGSRVYLGNSLPIREWDLFGTREARGYTYAANRGANGIDGQLSTFLGWCSPGAENVAVVGDLTAIYDMNAPWIVPQLEATRFRIVIVNNGGGRIFSRVPSLRRMDPAVRERIVENSHSYRFDSWAETWRIEESVDERQPDREATERFWQRYDALWP